MKRKKLLYFAPLAILGFAVFIALGAAIVRMLWNWLTPALFGWPQISFWQALALLALCRILFGRFGFRGGPAGRHRMPRWESMTPEERERFRERMRGRCGYDSAPAESEP